VWHPKPFGRPQTFQLVRFSPPAPPSAKPAAKPPAARPKTSTPTPAPKTAEKTPAPRRPEPPPENQESLDDLQDLLGSVAAPAVEVAVGVSDFKYQWYLNAICAKVEERWSPPYEKSGVLVKVAFTILRNGTISPVTLTQSCGDATLDNLGLRSIQLAAPFGELPVGFPDNSLQVAYTLRPIRK
jgi:periplasmic protein TonB